MHNKSQAREVRYPQNKEIGRQLLPGDRVTIAQYAGLSAGTIRDMMLGYRRITDKTARAIIRLMNERREIDQALDEIANQ